jgi:hypothetical protein
VTPPTIAIKASALFATCMFLAACNGGASTEPLPAPTAQETLESLDSLPGGIGDSDETPDAPPSPE